MAHATSGLSPTWLPPSGLASRRSSALKTLSTMSSTDPLLVLRQAIKAKKLTKLSNASGPADSLQSATHLILSSSATLPKSTPTRLRKLGATSTDPSLNPKDFFTLDAVYLAWQLKDASGAEYMKQARENGLAAGFVSITERKSVVDWLEGRTNDLQNLVPIVCESQMLLRADHSQDSHCYSRIHNTTRFPSSWCDCSAVNLACS